MAPSSASGPPSSGINNEEIDRLLQEHGIAPASKVLDTVQTLPAETIQASGLSSAAGSDSSSLPTEAGFVGGRHVKPKQLSMVSVQSTNIAPKEPVTYVKQTQTIESGPDVASRGRGGGGVDYYTLTYAYDDDDEKYEEDSIPGMGSGGSPSSGSPTGYLSKLPPGFLPTGMPEVKDVRAAVTKQDEEATKAAKAKEKAEEEKRRLELSEEEKQVIVMSEDFQKFFDRSTRLVERAIWEEPIFADYTGGLDGDGGEGGDADKAGLRLSLNRFFYDERWTKNRVVTSMDWSTVYPELMVASYDKTSEYSAHDPDGICLVWNTKFKKTTPEHVFHCQSPVTVTTFARFHPNLIIGGTYSG